MRLKELEKALRKLKSKVRKEDRHKPLCPKCGGREITSIASFVNGTLHETWLKECYPCLVTLQH